MTTTTLLRSLSRAASKARTVDQLVRFAARADKNLKGGLSAELWSAVRGATTEEEVFELVSKILVFVSHVGQVKVTPTPTPIQQSEPPKRYLDPFEKRLARLYAGLVNLSATIKTPAQLKQFAVKADSRSERGLPEELWKEITAARADDDVAALVTKILAVALKSY